jgi:acylphosphatase
MNRPDGRVEAVFEGDPSIVERCLAFVSKGPSGAQVSEVETESLPAGELPEFEIRY